MINLPDDISFVSLESEAEFKTVWQNQENDTPITRAVSAGIRADRLSWLFIAGYQSAIRLAFDGIPENEWWSFAVSEDKTGKAPGVVLADGKLSGTKTWVASCDHLDGVIVTTAGHCYQLTRHAAGVQFEAYASADFLPDMSTGKLCLTNVVPLSVIELKIDFRIAEATALMSASCGYLWRESKRYGERRLRRGCETVLRRLAELDQTNLNSIKSIYDEVAEQGKSCAAIAEARGDSSQKDWKQNGRLLSMYKKVLAGQTN